MTETTENVRVAPPEFGEGIAQFFVPKRDASPVAELLPVVFWVYVIPEANNAEQLHRLPDCICERVFRLTEQSFHWWRELTGYRLPSGKFPAICECSGGRLIE